MRCQAHDQEQARGIVRCKDRATFVVEAGRKSINLCDEHYARCTGRNFNFNNRAEAIWDDPNRQIWVIRRAG